MSKTEVFSALIDKTDMMSYDCQLEVGILKQLLQFLFNLMSMNILCPLLRILKASVIRLTFLELKDNLLYQHNLIIISTTATKGFFKYEYQYISRRATYAPYDHLSIQTLNLGKLVAHNSWTLLWTYI